MGFNASHSMGLILFGLGFGFLALAHGELLFHSPFLLVVGLAMLGGLVVLCKLHFFRGPLTRVSRGLDEILQQSSSCENLTNSGSSLAALTMQLPI